MGYTTRKHRGGETQHFWPDDTATEFYIEGGASLEEINEQILQKWGPIPLSQLRISAEFIHTDCLGYDLMDWGDYTNFLRITNTKGA